MIFTNPAGAPELACDECGCRWFDRQTDQCYECGAPVTAAAREEFARALAAFTARRGGGRLERQRVAGGAWPQVSSADSRDE
jgi:ribosomal protein L37E